MMSKLNIFYSLFSNTKNAFKFSLFLYLLSLIFNSSLRVMGFDLSSEVKSLLSGSFFLIILITNIKIFISYYLFYSIIELVLNLTNQPKNRYFIYAVFSYFTFLLFIESILHYPQVYGEFFYLKHTYLKPCLYFFTDHIKLEIIDYIIYLSLGILFVYNYILFFRNKKFIHLLLANLFSVSIIFHLFSFGFGIFILVILIQILKHIYKEAIIVKGVAFFHLFLNLFFISLGFYLYKYRFPNFSQNHRKHPNLILLSADSFRADRLSVQINGESITPNLDELKKEAFIFQDHHVTIPRTFPSWADLLTGEYSMTHKIRDMFPAPSERDNLGKPPFYTIGHYLQNSLKFTTAVISNFAGDIFPRADFGFEYVIAPDFNAKILIIQKNLEFHSFLLPLLTGSLIGGGEYFAEVNGFSSLGDGEKLNSKIFNFINNHKHSSFFLTAFYSVTHFPYSPPYPYYKKFTDPNYYGDYKYFKFVDPTNDKKPSEKDQNQIRGVFNSAIYSLDKNIGDVIQYLKKENLYDDTILIITGDHGESIYEDIHGHGHGEHLRGENITKVPLLIKFPKSSFEEEKKIFKGITSSIDLFPTLLDYYKIEPITKPSGESLLKILGKENWEYDRYVYSETGIWFSDIGDHFFQKQRIPYPSILKLHRIVPEEDFQIMITDQYYRDTIAFSKHRSIQSSNYKLIYIPTREGVTYEFYNRKIDPLNQNNLYNSNFNSEPMKRFLHELVIQKEKAKIISEYILPPSIE
jgi:hypothetical protein